jgi:glycosyltransferase involved in cell wall biosynthesis
MLHPRVQTPTSVNTRSTESLTSPFRDAVRVRVLIVVDYFLPSIGGVQTRVVPMIRELQRDGHACLVMTADLRRGEAPAVSDDRGLDVARFGLVEALAAGDVTGVARVLGQARRAISAFGPDVVHAFVSGPGVLPCLDSASAAVPLVASFTIWPTHAHAGPATLLGRVLSHASWVTANSQLLLRRLHELDPGTHARSSVLVSGNPPPLAPAVLLCLGRVVEEKGFDVAVRALARIPVPVRLIIAGDGPARTSLARLARELGVADRVEFTSWVDPDDVAALINRSTLVVVPSRWQEAFASVAIQAAQLGRPVLASRVGGMSEALLDGETGILFASEDDNALAAAITGLLDEPHTLERFGRSAHSHAQRAFSFDRYVADVESIYRRVSATAIAGGPAR